MSTTRLAISYAIFALISTAANIGAQELVTRMYSGALQLPSSIFFGTSIGLLVKYILDKRYIFKFKTLNTSHDTQLFALYTIMGLVTTMIFWGFEYGFHLIFESKKMRYFGGIIGLAIGYFIKYHLDKRFVFCKNSI